MNNKCLGCGALLQNNNENEIGYVVDLNMNYCQRCFKMIHYDQHKENDFLPDNNLIIEQLNQLDGNFVWIIDIFDFDSSLNSVLVDFYRKHSCNIILNKCDLLPTKINYEKLGKYVLSRIKKLNIKSKAIITRGINTDFIDSFNAYINVEDKPIIMTGLANVGKSTIINHLLKDKVVTVNRYPATTINFNEIKTEQYHIIDTIGIVAENTMQMYLTNKQLKTVVPIKQVRPIVFQLMQNQTLSIGGLARIDILNNEKANVVIYTSNLLKIKRSKLENADKLWLKNYGKELTPTLKGCESFLEMKKHSFTNKGKVEYFISGLGFITINCEKADIDIYTAPQIYVNVRKAMI
ncbi:MAG: ribosome biogenesis GTPase YqeH [Erysipelotrichia bacterium]|nr:ribosome biogenesis GTPase YqeH [Erysipelotrichia bacterium]